MKYKIIAVTIFFFLVFPMIKANAISPIELVVNDSFKTCQTYQPSSLLSLPEGWTYHEFEKSNYKYNHKAECERISYIYNHEILEGKVKSAFLVMKYSLLGFFAIISMGLLTIYLKTKKKKILTAIPIAIVLFLFIYMLFYDWARIYFSDIT